MKHLLSFELKKLSKQKSFYICSALILAFTVLGILMTNTLLQNPEINMLTPTCVSLLIGALSSSNFLMIFSIFVALFVCTDFSEQAIKNVYARGFTKESVYISKWLICLLTDAVVLTCTLLAIFVVGKQFFDFGTITTTIILQIVGLYLLSFAYTSFACASSILLKKVGAAVAIAIIGPSIVSMVLNLLNGFIPVENFSLANIWLDSFGTSIATANAESSRIIFCLAMSSVYFLLFSIVGFFVHRKLDCLA